MPTDVRDGLQRLHTGEAVFGGLCVHVRRMLHWRWRKAWRRQVTLMVSLRRIGWRAVLIAGRVSRILRSLRRRQVVVMLRVLVIIVAVSGSLRLRVRIYHIDPVVLGWRRVRGMQDLSRRSRRRCIEARKRCGMWQWRMVIVLSWV